MPRAVFRYVALPALALWALCQVFGTLPPLIHGFPVASYLLFATPSVAMAGALPWCAAAGPLGMADRDSGVLEGLMATVSLAAWLPLCEAIACGVAAAISALAVGLVAVLAGVAPGAGFGAVLALPPLAFLLASGFAALSILLTAVLDDRQSALAAALTAGAIGLLVSDALLPSALLPRWLEAFAGINPLTFALHGARAVLWQRPSSLEYLRDLALLAGCAGASLGTMTVVWTQRPSAGLTPQRA